MGVDEAKALLAELGRGAGPRSDAERETVERLYREVLGKRMEGCRCPDKWRDAVIEMHAYLKRHGTMKERSKYRLRAGVILQIAGSTEIYTNDNLTDEVAAAFLREHPNAAGRFEVIPAAAKRAATEETDAETAPDEPGQTVAGGEQPANAAGEDDGGSANAADDAIRQAVAEGLAAGKSKTALRHELAGREIGGVKLTHRLAAAYIERITAGK